VVAYDPEAEISAEERKGLARVKLHLEQTHERRMVSIRLKEDVIDGLKRAARKKGIPYQVLMQMWLQERLQTEVQTKDTPQPLLRLRQLSNELQEVVDGLSRPE